MSGDRTPERALELEEVTTLSTTPTQMPRDRRQLLVFTEHSSWMFQLPKTGTVIIGRSEVADLQLPDPTISRQHAKIDIERDCITITDLGSQNGTYVNRERLHLARPLEPGDTITINTSTLILHAPPTPSAHVLVDLTTFRQRVEDELERALRYHRSFALLTLEIPRVQATERIERTLRRIDSLVWLDDRHAQIMLAEASEVELSRYVVRLREMVSERELRVGTSLFPSDGSDGDALLSSARLAASVAAPGETVRASRGHQTLSIGTHRVIVADPEMVRLYALVERLAGTALPVLVTGETGAGKEMVALALHHGSIRRDHAMVTLNCAAIAETLVESELFGHEKGAFSGAVSTKVGLLESAHRSTLFLDEIGELAAQTQAKLLRVIETRRFTRVGDVKERESDVRIVAATNRNLGAEAAENRFRQDLYFRLSGAELYVPPLRERPRELPLLAQAFLDEACSRGGGAPMHLTEAAMRALLAHSWPGNVRELKNTMQYLAAAFPGAKLDDMHVRSRLTKRPARNTPLDGMPSIPADAGEVPSFRPLAEEMRELEINRMKAALEATGNNQTRAALLLSVPARTFFEKVKLYGLLAKKSRD
jgi:two-component system, NtrC family, response regulator AtoC